MKPVDPNQRTTLLLNSAYQPMAIITARAAFHHLITSKVKGLDSDGNTYSFGQRHNVYEDNPVLRSAHTVHTVPTVAICTNRFIKFRRAKEFPSTRALYNLYKGICQYCLRKISISEATKDHWFPKSLGGTNHDFNLVLSCKRCNNHKDSTFPYYNKNGEEVKPKVSTSHILNMLSNIDDLRDEWKPFLFIGE